MTMLFVIPIKKYLTKGSGILNRTKAFRELRTILQRLELGFRVWVVIAHMWSAVGFSYPQIAEKMCNHL